MVHMHDAPLISPENKDYSPEILAGLPKVDIDVTFEPAQMPTTPEELTAALRTTVENLVKDNVVYAEIRLDPQSYGFGVEAALEAAESALGVEGIDARLLLTSAPQSAIARKGSTVAGYVISGELDEQVVADLRANFVPFVADVEGEDFQAVAAAVQAGATRLAHATQLIDDFGADLDGIRPGTVSCWIRDRHIALSFDPLREVAELPDHPLPLLQQLGFTCALSAGAGDINETFVALTQAFGYGLEEYFDLTIKAIENSFSSQEERQVLIEEVILPAYEEFAQGEEE